MAADRFLGTVLSTVDAGEFRRDVFARRHALFRNSNALRARLTARDIDDYLTTWEGFLHTFVVATLDSARVFISADGDSPLTQKQQIGALYRKGATLKVSGFETRHPLIAPLCRDLELGFGGSAFAKAFLTAPGRTGYDVHFDGYDTFVMQLDGSKHWCVYAQAAIAPTEETARQMSADEAGAPIGEYVLEPGDVLYMPSGFPHSARCTERHSMHITIGFDAWRANRIAEYCIAALADRSESVRGYVLPGAADPAAAQKLKTALREIAAELERADPRQLLDAYQLAAWANKRPIQDSTIRNAALEPQIGPTARFSFDPSSLHSYSVDPAREVAQVRIGCSLPSAQGLTVQPPTMELPAFVEPELKSIFSMTGPFGVRDVDGALDEQSRLLLLREMTKQSIVNVEDAG